MRRALAFVLKASMVVLLVILAAFAVGVFLLVTPQPVSPATRLTGLVLAAAAALAYVLIRG